MTPAGAAAQARIVSLVPSVTETLAAWGLVPLACTRFCERPDLPHVGGTKDPDVAAIVRLAPDMVVVCDEENRREDADELQAAGLAVHSCSPRSVSEVGPALVALAGRLGLEVPPEPALTADASLGLRAFVPVWRRPWMTMNGQTYGSDLLGHLGVINIFADDTERYPATDLEAVKRRRPDVVLAPSEPYPFGPRHTGELDEVAPTILVDGQDLFWWGVRTPAALGRLRQTITAGRQDA